MASPIHDDVAWMNVSYAPDRSGRQTWTVRTQPKITRGMSFDRADGQRAPIAVRAAGASPSSVGATIRKPGSPSAR